MWRTHVVHIFVTFVRRRFDPEGDSHLMDIHGLTTDKMEAERAELIAMILNVARMMQHIF